MFIKELYLKNFRCFSEKKLSFESNIVVIEGPNGVGKTTLLEALHYACYLHSFRTNIQRDMLLFKQENFLIKVAFEHDELEYTTKSDLQITYVDKNRLVKFNNKALDSYKELMNYYRIITLTEDDLELIKLGPEVRRRFVDQAILLYNPAYLLHLREYKVILENRNKLLQNQYFGQDMYDIWTAQLWRKTEMLQQERKEFLHVLQQEVTTLLQRHLPDVSISFVYAPKKNTLPVDLIEQERRMGRSLFGAHLDDVNIVFRGTSSRTFASRGQQKLTLLLIKIAQIKALARQKGPAIFLLDDFITDFDGHYAKIVLEMLLDLNSQLIFTIPVKSSVLTEMLLEKGAQHIEISS